MKRIIFLFKVLLFITSLAKANNSPAFGPRATFDSLWVDYNITEDGQKGMRIHLNFSAYEMKNMDAYVAIYFEYDDDIAGFLKDKNDKFSSSEGDVAVYRSIKPAYDPAVYTDLTLFMPYTELDLEPGIYDLSMDVKLIYKEGGVIQKLTLYDFEYTKPGSPADVESATQASAKLSDMWIDYDVTENGKRGMRIHVSFTAMNLKGVDCYVAVYFEKKSGERIQSTTEGYRSKGGQLAVYKSFKPNYAEAQYKDLQLFVPYTEINLPKGKFDLRLAASIILQNGDMVTKLKSIDFIFTQ